MNQRFAWIPWIKEQGDVLVEEVMQGANGIEMVPLRFHTTGDEEKRRSVLDFAVQCPTAFARLFERRLMELDGPLHGLVLTLDWIGPMKVAASVARHHGLPVIIVPHEGMYLEAKRFYLNPYDGTNVPMGDVYLAWGGLQKEQISKRGYPEEKILTISSPKLQAARTYEPKLSCEEYAHRLGIESNRPNILFAAQNLDNAPEPDTARRRQADALEGVYNTCRKNGFELIVRLPPANISPIFQDEIQHRFGENPPFKMTRYEDGRPELAPREALFHAACVVSISSTMMLEKALMNGPTLVLDYIGVKCIFAEQGQCASASTGEEIDCQLPELVAGEGRSFSDDGWKWMQWAFSDGSFDGTDAHEKIIQCMKTCRQAHFLAGRPALFAGMFKASALPMLLFHACRKLPMGRTIARRLFGPVA